MSGNPHFLSADFFASNAVPHTLDDFLAEPVTWGNPVVATVDKLSGAFKPIVLDENATLAKSDLSRILEILKEIPKGSFQEADIVKYRFRHYPADDESSYPGKRRTFLHLACLCADYDIAKALIDHGLDPYIQDIDGLTSVQILTQSHPNKERQVARGRILNYLLTTRSKELDTESESETPMPLVTSKKRRATLKAPGEPEPQKIMIEAAAFAPVVPSLTFDLAAPMVSEASDLAPLPVCLNDLYSEGVFTLDLLNGFESEDFLGLLDESKLRDEFVMECLKLPIASRSRYTREEILQSAQKLVSILQGGGLNMNLTVGESQWPAARCPNTPDGNYRSYHNTSIGVLFYTRVLNFFRKPEYEQARQMLIENLPLIFQMEGELGIDIRSQKYILIEACMVPDLDINLIKILLNLGADPSVMNRQGLTPLTYIHDFYSTLPTLDTEVTSSPGPDPWEEFREIARLFVEKDRTVYETDFCLFTIREIFHPQELTLLEEKFSVQKPELCMKRTQYLAKKLELEYSIGNDSMASFIPDLRLFVSKGLDFQTEFEFSKPSDSSCGHGHLRDVISRNLFSWLCSKYKFDRDIWSEAQASKDFFDLLVLAIQKGALISAEDIEALTISPDIDDLNSELPKILPFYKLQLSQAIVFGTKPVVLGTPPAGLPASTTDSTDMELACLFLDGRMKRTQGHLVTSTIVGSVTHFL